MTFSRSNLTIKKKGAFKNKMLKYKKLIDLGSYRIFNQKRFLRENCL